MEINGGLINLLGATHVIVAVQALLRSTCFLEAHINIYQDHRKNCRSCMQCITCTFFRLYSSICNDGKADPTSLVIRWNGISSHMVTEKKTDPFQVICVFIDLIRAEFLYSKSECSAEKEGNFPSSQVFATACRVELQCPTCGKHPQMEYFSAIELNEVSDLQNSTDGFFENRMVMCMKCRLNVPSTLLYILPPECLIVHVNQTTPQFVMPLHLNVHGEKLSFRTAIVEQAGAVRFISRNLDGSFKLFEDTKISAVNFQNVISCNSKLTLFYEIKEAVTQPQGNHHRKVTRTRIVNRTSKSSKCIATKISEMHLSSGDEAVLDLSEIEQSDSVVISGGVADASTQPCISTVHKGVQTTNAPFYSYEFCNRNEKFKFFTGLCVQDFKALYDLIGGHAVISRLKYKFAQSTPQKLRHTVHTSEDKLFMFLLRLRRGLPLEELSQMFNCSVSWAGEICYAMTRLIYLTLKEMEDEMFATAAQQKKDKPQKMRPFKNLRILMDGVSFRTQTPTNFEHQGNMYSKYKAHTVIVFSVGISCKGATIFCSDGMEGSMSDKEVILKSGLLERLSPGDAVMTDKGYELTGEFQAV